MWFKLALKEIPESKTKASNRTQASRNLLSMDFQKVALLCPPPLWLVLKEVAKTGKLINLSACSL